MWREERTGGEEAVFWFKIYGRCQRRKGCLLILEPLVCTTKLKVPFQCECACWGEEGYVGVVSSFSFSSPPPRLIVLVDHGRQSCPSPLNGGLAPNDWYESGSPRATIHVDPTCSGSFSNASILLPSVPLLFVPPLKSTGIERWNSLVPAPRSGSASRPRVELNFFFRVCDELEEFSKNIDQVYFVSLLDLPLTGEA